MCGITGYIDIKNKVHLSSIQQMTDALIHRGPDDGAVFISKNQHLAFGHRRLSFLDLSTLGKQPFISNDGEVIITFNGEIYNYLELKVELSNSYDFKTNTDTEVLVAAYQKWGIQMLSKLNGMFAFGIFDQKLNQLFLVRDRFGIKPMYFTFQDNRLLFASELKAILAINEIKKELDFSSFIDFFVYRYIPSPKSIWKNIQKLPPASFATIKLDTLSCEFAEYWKIEARNKVVSEQELVSEVKTILLHSMKEHTRADVPIGSFLSGGYDSSALVLFLKKLKLNPETFSIGFSNWEKSEDQYAKIVANHLNLNNHSVVADDASLKLVDCMSTIYDEPIADISIVPTFLVSKLANSKVKAVVSGEGADEIFGGYTWQHEFMKIQYPTSILDKMKKVFRRTDPIDFYANAMAMGEFDVIELKKMLQPHLHKYIPTDLHWFYRQHFDSSLSPLKSIQYLDLKCFMGELVLTKIDRASMANSLEVRVPFLDHNLVEYIFSLEESSYFKSEQTKFALFKNIEQELPIEILQRKKQGFVGPDSFYMDVDWYKSQFKNSKLVELNLVNPRYIDDLFSETYTWKLWKLLIMEKWLCQWC